MGDPAGVGPEVSLKACKRRGPDGPRLVLFGDADVFTRLNRESGLAMPSVAETLDEALAIATQNGTSLLHIDSLGDRWKPAQVTAETGKASYRYITAAIDAALTGQVAGVVTGPIHKEALRLSGVAYPGHTEIFEALTRSTRACMMLTSDALTCSFVTTHVGLCEVPGLISTERVLDVIELTNQAIRSIHGRPSRLVVCGLNPHAGESGLFGDREEERFIIPAIESARSQGIHVEGPLPPDTAFLPARRQRTDAFICMYHDQGHIPLKALSFETAVNTTLGLPIVRTSVDHGTALDIAWKRFDADPTSMLQAIDLATRLRCRNGDFQSPIASKAKRETATESRRHAAEVSE
jgi:4-phospho-D-threonate 3-dehydrogenase / 4-phospho-D-erythronate 3-dehydrogenase